jgi:hypothetical protein
MLAQAGRGSSRADEAGPAPWWWGLVGQHALELDQDNMHIRERLHRLQLAAGAYTAPPLPSEAPRSAWGSICGRSLVLDASTMLVYRGASQQVPRTPCSTAPCTRHTERSYAEQSAVCP